MKKSYYALCMALALSFTACTDDIIDNPVNGGGSEKINETPITVFDDLDYFQSAIIPVDSTGTMLCRSYGEILYDKEPDHLYIGVKDLAEAETMFRSWIAPDVELSTTVPTTSGLTCPLTDLDGKPQGTLYFTPGTENKIVAEVTASSDTQLKHFKKITFLLNAAWPMQSSVYHKYTEGDIITYKPAYSVSISLWSGLHPEDETMGFVCIRQGGNGKKPLFLGITKGKYECFMSHNMWQWLRHSSYGVSLSKAEEISKILRTAWDVYAKAFDLAGSGRLYGDPGCWTTTYHGDWVTFYDYIYLASGASYGATWGDPLHLYEMPEKPYLIKIDWLDDDAINTGLVATAGSPGLKYDDHYEEYPSLFDGCFDTKWCSTTGQKTDGVWFVEFQTNAPVIPTSYKMTTANDSEKYKGRNPKSWKLYGKTFSNDEWTLLSEIQDGRMTDINCRTYNYPINKQEKGYGYYMFYRLEISSVVDSNVLMLSEFNLSIQNTIDPDHVITVTAGTQREDGEDPCANLFNTNTGNYWYCQSQFKQNDLWFVEFQTEKPGTPVGYNLYTSALSAHDYSRHPKDWKLYGKLESTAEWTLIDEQTGQDLPHSFYTAQNYIISNPAEYQYYRFEVSAVNGDDKLILGGFEFVYDD